MAPIASPVSTVSLLPSPPSKRHVRPHDVLTVHSDTDSATSDDDAGVDSPHVLSATKRWTAYRQLARHECFTSGHDAVLHVAGHVSESVFVYPLLNRTPSSASSATPLRARVTTLEIRQGAGDAVRGALAVGTSATAFIPSQTLPLFLPNLFAIAHDRQPAVFHVACEAIRPDLSIGSSYESIYALQHAGAILLNASSAQELHDLAVIAHVVAARLKKLVVHFYDGARVANELTKLQLLTPSSLTQLAQLTRSPLNASAHEHDQASAIQSIMDELFPVLQHQYNIYEYYGAPDATTVLVVMGEASHAIQQAVAYEQMLGHKVGVVHVRLLLPWSHALFANALPRTVQRVAVLENLSAGAFAFQRGLLTQQLQVFFHSAYWTSATSSSSSSSSPMVVTGLYGGVCTSTGFSIGMARAVFHHVNHTTSRRSFVVATSDDALTTSVAPLEVVLGHAFELPQFNAYTKHYLLLSDDMTSTQPNPSTHHDTLALLHRNPATHVRALWRHSAPTALVPRAIASVHIAIATTPSPYALPHGMHQHADVTVVTDVGLLHALDVAATVKPQGVLLVHCDWKTIDDVDASPQLIHALASHQLTLLVVDVHALQAQVADPVLAHVASHVAFFKAAGLFTEEVVYALLQSQFPSTQHQLLQSFVGAVWGDVVGLVYPLTDVSPASYVAEEELASSPPLPLVSSLASSKLATTPLTTTLWNKRRLAHVSTDTQTAWKFVFPEPFQTRQKVRDHVTDIVTVTKWTRLTPSEYSRNVFHVEMDIRNTKITYQIGEALAVFAHNQPSDVLRFLQSYDQAPDALVSLPVAMKSSGKHQHDGLAMMEETVTYFQLFSQVLDIFGRPSKKFYHALAQVATNDEEKTVLLGLLEADGKDALKERVDETLTYADLLVEFPSAKPTMQHLLQLIPRIKPRHYSIASSMKMNPTSVHLLIVVHDWTTPRGRYRIGQATDFLKDVQPGQLLSVSVCSSVMKLPRNPADPIIMAGLGTGMAPFRAFIQERAFLKAHGVAVGPVALYFGARSKQQEFLYGEELEQYEREGLLTRLRCAFSRDQAHKIYIQDRIAEDQSVLGAWLLHQNAHFYLCGPTWPVADVREALIGAIMAEGGLDRKQANAYIERMREQGRYVLEVY